MTAITGNSEIVSEFAKILGLDPNITRKVVITMAIDDVVTVEAEQHVKESQFKELIRSFKKYKMVGMR